jgi:alkanesulfonate monooxygenase
LTDHVEFGWVFPSTGDGHYLGLPQPPVPPGRKLLLEFGGLIDTLPYEYLLVTTGQRNNHFGAAAPYVDSLVTAAALGATTRRIKLLIAIRPGLVEPPFCARACASIDQFTEGRFMLNLVSGGQPLRQFGETLSRDDRYRRSTEFLDALLGLWSGEAFSYDGRFYTLDSASSVPGPWQGRRPEIYVSGTSEDSVGLAAHYADCTLAPGATLDRLARFVAATSRAAQEAGRTIRTGTHFYVVARASQSSAMAAAERILSRVRPGATLAAPDMAKAEFTEVAPGLWDGMKRLTAQPTPIAIGSYRRVAETLQRFRDIGITSFILHGYPSAQEATRIAECVLPRLR